MDTRSEQELVALLPRFRRFALGLTRNSDAADDLVQAALEKAIARFEQWQPGTRLDSWVYRIIQTTHIDLIRGQKRQSQFLEVVEAEGEKSVDGQAAAEAHITLDAVRHAIYNLPEEQRAVIMLVSVEGLSYKEAAESLSIPIGTLTSRLVRGRTALMNMLNTPDNIAEQTGDDDISHLEKGAKP